MTRFKQRNEKEKGKLRVIGCGGLLGAFSGGSVNARQRHNNVLTAILKGYCFLLIVFAGTNDGLAKDAPLPINYANISGDASLRWSQPIRYAVVSFNIVVKLTGGANLFLNEIAESVSVGNATTNKGGEIAKKQTGNHGEDKRNYFWWWLAHIGGIFLGLFFFASGLFARTINALTPNSRDDPHPKAKP